MCAPPCDAFAGADGGASPELGERPGTTVQNVYFNNVVAFGPKTTAGTQFLFDATWAS